MTGIIIALTLMGVFILALMSRIVLLETKLDEVIKALNDHAEIIDSMDVCLNDHYQRFITLEDKTKWLDDIDTNKIFNQ